MTSFTNIDPSKNTTAQLVEAGHETMLSQTQIDRFKSDGYLVVENVVDQNTLDALKAEYSDRLNSLYEIWYEQGLVDQAPGDMSFWEKLDQCYAGGFDWYQPLDISLPNTDITDETPMHIGPAVFAMATHKRILDIVESLIGPEISSNPIQHVRIKPPQRVVPKSETRAHIISTDWHQDQGVTMPEADETQFVTVWLAVTDATIENGCLQVASGKRNEMLPHCTRTQVGIADKFIPIDDAVPTPVKAGGAVIFHPLTPHASLENKSDGYRWSFDLRYHVSGQPSGRRQFPEFVARSRTVPESELHDWKVWQEMWEDARYKLTRSEHIPQHRWDSSSPHCA